MAGQRTARRQHQRDEDAKLRRRAKQHQLQGFYSSGPKSIIAPMPMNSSSGNSSLAHARFKQPPNDALALAHARVHLVDSTGQRQVDKNRAEAHRQQKTRFHLL